MQELFNWIALPVMAALALGYFEALTRKAEEDSRSKLKDHEQSWAFLEDRASRMKWYRRIMIVSTIMNIGIMVGRIVAKNYF